MSAVKLSPILDTDVPELCRIELEARKDVGLSQAMYPLLVDDPEARLNHAIFKSTYQLARSTSICLKATVDSQIVGYVIWDDPDHPQAPRIGPPSTDQEQEEHRAAIARIHSGADMTLMKSMGEQHSAAESTVHGKHWFLSNLVVKRDRQGLGIGSVLLDWGLTRADEVGLPVFCLSSDEGYKLYSRRGFEVMRWCEFKSSTGAVTRERALVRPAKVVGAVRE